MKTLPYPILSGRQGSWGQILAFSEILGHAQIISPFVQYGRVFVAAASLSHTNISIVPTYGAKGFPTIATASELLRTLPQLKLKPTTESWIRLIPKQEARNCQMFCRCATHKCAVHVYSDSVHTYLQLQNIPPHTFYRVVFSKVVIRGCFHSVMNHPSTAVRSDSGLVHVANHWLPPFAVYPPSSL